METDRHRCAAQWRKTSTLMKGGERSIYEQMKTEGARGPIKLLVTGMALVTSLPKNTPTVGPS